MSRLLALREQGQSPWLDNLSRTLLRDGELQRLIDDGLSGVTSNPSIFQKAIADGRYYREDLAEIARNEDDAERRYEALVTPDIQAACDLFREVFAATDGDDGYVSLEVSPHLAYDTDATVEAALRLRAAVDRANVLIKVPATPPGVVAVERLTAMGVNVNVTLMFSLVHCHLVADAYMRGAREWIASGGEARALKSVASLFLSRVDTLIDERVTRDSSGSEESMPLRGRTGVALAKCAYQDYLARFHGEPFADLGGRGVRPQYMLWGSTGTKNPQYSDLLYVEPLIGPETVNTLPDATLAAFQDHGAAVPMLTDDLDAAHQQLARLEAQGIDLEAVGEELQRAGVDLFIDAFDRLQAEVAT